MLNSIVRSEDFIVFDTHKKVAKAKRSFMLEELIEKKRKHIERMSSEDNKNWTSIENILEICDVDIAEYEENILGDIDITSIPMIITPYEVNKVIDSIDKQSESIIPILVNDNSIFVGPLVEKKDHFKTYIMRLAANNPMLKEKINLKLNNYEMLYINNSLLLKYKKEIAEALKQIELNKFNSKVFYIENDKVEIHKFLDFKNNNVFNHEPGDLMDALDSKLGIVTELDTESLKDIGVDMFISISTTTDYSIYDENLFSQANSGAGFDKKSAEYSAVGESIERLAAGCYSPDTILSSWNELNEKAVDPEKFILFSEDQYREKAFPYKKFDRNLKVNWVKSVNLTKGFSEYIPLALVKLPYRATLHEERITPSLSTGLALGNSKEQAILSGIFEAVERDAFSVSWFLKLAPNRRLNIKDYISHFEEICDVRYVCNVYDISLQGLFNTALVTIHDSETNNFMIGCATRFTMELAVKKAFLEAAQGITYVSMLVNKFRDDNMIENLTKINTFQKHAAFYSIYPEARKKVKYVLEKDYSFVERKDSKFEYEGIMDLSDSEKLNIAIETLRKCDKDINYVDLTTHEIETLGASAAKIVIPGLHPLHGSHLFRFLNPNRLNVFKDKYNLKGEINKFPHPFP